MDLPLVDILIVAAYLVGMLVFGTWLSRFVRSEKDYFLAGKSLPFWAIGMSIVVSDIGAMDFVALSGQSYRYGIVAANMDWIGTMPAIILAAFVFIPYYWRSGVYSVPEYLGRRYNGTVRTLLSGAWVLILIANLGLVFWAAAQMFDEIINPELWGGIGENGRFAGYIALTAIITGVYTISGGLAAVVYTDAIQLVIMFFGAALVVGIGLGEVGGFSGMEASLTEMGKTQHLTLLLPHDSTTPFPWTGVFFGLALVLAPAYFIGNQAIVQRTLGAKSEWSAKAGTLFGGFLKFAIPFLVVVPGLIGLVLFPDLSDGDRAFGRLVRELLPMGVRGVVFAGFLAALMSSVDSLLASTATMITRDLWLGAHEGGVLSGRPSDRSLLVFGRVTTGVLVVLGALSAPISTMFEGVYTAIQSLFAIIQGPSLAILIGGMFWRRATPAAAVWTICVGVSVATSLFSWQKYAAYVKEPTPFNAAEPFFMIAAISCAVSFLTLFLVSHLTRPKSIEELRGLVFRGTLGDDEAQGALRDRGEEEDDA